MGSMIHLAVGRLEVDWGKNHGFTDHSALYQSNDVCKVPYYYADEIIEYKEGLSKPLSLVVDRIELLGYTLAYCEREYLFHSELISFDADRFSFQQLHQALSTVDVHTISSDYSNRGVNFGEFFRREIYPRLNIPHVVDDAKDLEFRICYAMENISAYTIIKLLASNPNASLLPVQWSFNDLEVGGWAKRGDFIRPVDRTNRFLIVTEGSSDAAIIRHALSILKPHIVDFFDFVDMEEGYPFSGTGNLVNFVKGLISISIQNNVIIIFDNDTEGVASYNKCKNLNVPENMQILKLPDHPDFNEFQTTGPNGVHLANINGQGAAIECYLDLDQEALLRWNNYNAHINCYQGELLKKDDYKRSFLSQREKTNSYNYEKIEAVLNLIIQNCVRMKESWLIKDLDLEE